MTSTAPPPESVDLNELGRRIRGRLGVFLGLIGLGVGVAVLYTLLWPPKYEAKATLYFPSRPPSMLSLPAGGGEAGALAALTGGGTTTLDIYRGFLESESALDELASGVNMEREEAIKHRKFESDFRNNTLTIFGTSSDKDQAMKIVRLHLNALEKINARTQQSFQSEDVKVLENEVKKERATISQLESKLVSLQRNAKSAPSIISQPDAGTMAMPGNWAQQLKALQIKEIDVQSKLAMVRGRFAKMSATAADLPVSLPPIAALRPKLVAAETELKAKSAALGPDAPEIKRLKESITAIRKQMSLEASKYLRALQSGTAETGKDPGIEGYVELLLEQTSISAQRDALKKIVDLAPEEAAELNATLREIAMRGQLLAKATIQYQAAKLQMTRDPIKWTILDQPRLEDKPVNKKLGMNLSMGIAAGLVLGALVSIRKPL